MARKKAVTEPQEEQMPDAAVPMEDTSGAEFDPGPAEDAPGGMDPPGMEGSAPGGDFTESGDSGGGDLPVGDDISFDPPADGDVPPGEEPGLGILSPSDGESGMGDVSADPDGDADSEDYAALLAAVSQGGMEPVPLPEDEGSGETDMDGEGQDSSPGEMPPMPPEDYAGALPSASDGEDPTAATGSPTPARVVDRRTNPRRERVLTVDPRAEVLTQQDLEDIIWHELENAQRTGHLLTGKLGGVERTRNGMDTAIILYKGVKVLVPLKEMGVHTGSVPSGPDYAPWAAGVIRVLSARQNSDVDFMVRGFGDSESGGRIVVGSRRDAMRRKRRRFYLDTDELGRHMIEQGSLVQARVVAVTDKALRLEVFGVECNVVARGISWMWVSSARDKHYVGELIPVRVTKIERYSAGRIAIRVDARELFGEAGDNLSQCQLQGRYVGEVTDVHKGRVFIRLDIGVNALAHECRDMRMPGRKDTVSFTVTRLDEKNGIAIGIITRIIKQNL